MSWLQLSIKRWYHHYLFTYTFIQLLFFIQLSTYLLIHYLFIHLFIYFYLLFLGTDIDILTDDKFWSSM